ncbi:putative N-acetyltransferase 8B [Pseudophryne corroboree]|uniref:putative N-acetyltransferase 8B n=1 Tax=Pseudophryne corroboree TaxID=495146 RepID=UPI00308179A6
MPPSATRTGSAPYEKSTKQGDIWDLLQEKNMADYSIRIYQDSDYQIVREIFACGLLEHTSAAFRHTLSLSHIRFLLAVGSLVPLLTTGSIAISLMVVTIFLVILWFINRHIFTSYVQQSLGQDMLEIGKYYCQRDDCCFWVAESAGEVVGMVAAAPFCHPGDKKLMELKRLSVPKRHRGKGIAKALCRTVIDFARKRGFQALTLNTSVCQISSWKLYEKIGFRRTRTFFPNYYFAELIDLRDINYWYVLPTQD